MDSKLEIDAKAASPTSPLSPASPNRRFQMLLHKPRHTLANTAPEDSGMCYVRLPSNEHPLALGFQNLPMIANENKDDNAEDGDRIDRNVVLFIGNRGLVPAIMLIMVYAAIGTCFLLASILFGYGEKDTQGVSKFILTIFLSFLGVFGVYYKNTHVLNIFIWVTYVEAMLGALSLTNMLAFGVFLAKMGVCYSASNIHSLLLTKWFSPLH